MKGNIDLVQNKMTVFFTKLQNKYDISTYPYYHTGYETFYMLETYTDPGFKILQGCSRLVALTLKYYADSALIPYSLEQLSKAIEKNLIKAKENGNGAKLLNIYDKFCKYRVNGIRWITLIFESVTVILSIYIPWPFPPVWGVADNTKETTKTSWIRKIKEMTIICLNLFKSSLSLKALGIREGNEDGYLL